MKKYIYLIAIFLLTNLLLDSCATKKSNLSKREEKILEQKEDFMRQHNIYYKVDKISYNSHLFLPVAEKDILVEIPLNFDGINYIKWHSKWINEDRLLIRRSEYFYDYVHKKLYVVFNIPYIYFLVPIYEGSLDINGFSYIGDNIVYSKAVYNFRFYWKPAKVENGAKFSFTFSNNLIKDYDELPNDVKNALKEELKRLNKHRLSNEYKKLVNKLEDVM